MDSLATWLAPRVGPKQLETLRFLIRLLLPLKSGSDGITTVLASSEAGGIAGKLEAAIKGGRLHEVVQGAYNKVSPSPPLEAIGLFVSCNKLLGVHVASVLPTNYCLCLGRS